MKSTYAKTTKEKTKDTRSIEAILKAYDDGELLVPCVQLQCIGFDAELYQAMVTEYAKVGSARKEKSSSSSSNKRALEYDADDDSAGSQQAYIDSDQEKDEAGDANASEDGDEDEGESESEGEAEGEDEGEGESGATVAKSSFYTT